MKWPARGVYFFREAGESRSDTGEGLRVVRVGTHALKAGGSTGTVEPPVDASGSGAAAAITGDCRQQRRAACWRNSIQRPEQTGSTRPQKPFLNGLFEADECALRTGCRRAPD